jgi:hypothetical protein
MKNLNQQLLKLTDDDFSNLLSQVEVQRAKKKKAANKISKNLKPKGLSTKDFETLVARTKELFLGRWSSESKKLVLNLQIDRLLAWVSDFEPQYVTTNVKIEGKELPNWLQTDLETRLTDHYLGAEEDTEAEQKMQAEIKILIKDIETKEKELRLPKDTLWEAVYERCAKYSH